MECGNIEHRTILVNVRYRKILVRDEIKSSGKFAIFTRLKIEGGGGQMHISEKLPLKIQTVEYIDVKMTQNDLDCNRDKNKVLKPYSVWMAMNVYLHYYLQPNSASTEKLPLKIEGGGSEIQFLVL